MLLFEGEIIEVYKGEQIDRLARQKPVMRPGTKDIGRLMDFLPNLRIGPLGMTSRNDDYKILSTWKKHLKDHGIPYVIVRRNRQIIKLYKERRVSSVSKISKIL